MKIQVVSDSRGYTFVHLQPELQLPKSVKVLNESPGWCRAIQFKQQCLQLGPTENNEQREVGNHYRLLLAAFLHCRAGFKLLGRSPSPVLGTVNQKVFMSTFQQMQAF